MLYLFVKKLYQLNKHINKNSDQKTPANESLLIKILVKYIILCSFQYISTIFMVLACLALAELGKNGITYTVGMIAYYTEAIINMTALYLQYKFGETHYYKYCKSCHKCVLYCVQISKNSDNVVDLTGISV